jgi:hypothetical protein
MNCDLFYQKGAYSQVLRARGDTLLKRDLTVRAGGVQSRGTRGRDDTITRHSLGMQCQRNTTILTSRDRSHWDQQQTSARVAR